MAQSHQFYAERAREAAAEAKTATLDNVRERALRSAMTWRRLALIAKKVARGRERLKSDKAEACAETCAGASPAETA